MKKTFRSVWFDSQTHKRQPGGLHGPRPKRLRLEPLEDRRLLAAAPLHVDIDSTAPTPDGNTWATAYVSLQDALDRATVLNTDADPANDVDQVWIAEGTYTPTALLEIGDARSASFSLLDGVTLYGGFAGNEATLEQRDWSAHVTTLSGDLGVVDDPSDNAYTVVYCCERIAVGIDGVSITGGNADGLWDSDHSERIVGGGICNDAGTLTVTNSTVWGNAALGGGGIRNYEGTLTVTDSTISDNSARTGGGGISNYSSMLTVTGSTFSGNSAEHGSGIHSRNGTITVTDSTLSGNSASGNSGGGIFSDSSTLTFIRSTFSGNSALCGGAIFSRSGTVTVTHSTLSGNSANIGGGIYNNLSTFTVTNSTISGNETDGDAGGIFNVGRLTVTNSIILGNSAGDDGGGICSREGKLIVTNSTISGNESFHYGGGICGSETLTVTNSTISGNVARGISGGGGIYSRGGLTVTNSIVALNEASYGSNVNGWMMPDSGNNLIGVEPEFIRDPSDGGDGWADDPDTADIDESANNDYGDLHLTAGSPAIDAGSIDGLPSDTADLDGDGDLTESIPYDLDGKARVLGAAVDIGAFEFGTDIPDITIPGDSPLVIELSGSSDPILTNNSVLEAANFTLTGSSTLELQWLPGVVGDGLFGGIYTIATYSGTLSGTFADVALLAADSGADASVYIDTTYGIGGIDYGSGTGDAITVKLNSLLVGDANLDGDVDVFAIDGSGDAQTLTSNLGTASGMTWSDGDFNFDGDVDVFAMDGSGDAQLLTANLGANLDIPAVPVIDMVLEQTAAREQDADAPLPTALPATLDWQYEYEHANMRSKRAKSKHVEATVDYLLATDLEL